MLTTAGFTFDTIFAGNCELEPFDEFPDELPFPSPSPLPFPGPLPFPNPLFPFPGTNGDVFEVAVLLSFECTASLIAAPTPADARTSTTTATSASVRRIALLGPD